MISESDKNSVLIVDDEKANIIALTKILSKDYTVYAAKNGHDAIWVAKEYLPDVILLDIVMPEIDGFQTLSMLKKSEETQSIPVIFITGLSNTEYEEKGLDLGAADYISKPYSPSIVRLRVRNQIKIVNQIRVINHLSTTDQLTNIPNRRSFSIQMNKEWSRNMREEKPLGLLMLDIDRFKVFNDTYGHQLGDEALRIISATLKESLRRSSDFVARWGGEEFAVLLPNSDINGAWETADRIRKSIEQIPIPISNEESTRLTVSIGVSSIVPTPDCNQEALFMQADKALYAAKDAGRNKVLIFNSMM